MRRSKQLQPDFFALSVDSTKTKDFDADFLAPIFDAKSGGVDWHEGQEEGQLAVDVLQTKTEVIVISPMGGAVTDKIEVYAHNDVLTIRGERKPPLDKRVKQEYFHQECFWGKFSRTVVLPVDVKGELAKAEYKNGVLTVRIPKQRNDSKIPVVVVDD